MAFSQRRLRGWRQLASRSRAGRWLQQEQVETGIAHIYEGLAAQQAMDARLFRPAFLSPWLRRTDKPNSQSRDCACWTRP